MENLKSLTVTELKEINGGHDGTAYEIGKAVGTTVKYARYVALAVSFFFS
ncbi:hypothetical protein KRE40_16365 [Elizabethkingia meningoseptica]|nr:hypothetical protein [Elizabethkingia meningoseptica]MDE5439541.1 hypothetical protein [Elizabethkingia meningoseptica]MDE5510210.1 hypothetical protein [Elizabethkingia meningoseptica]